MIKHPHYRRILEGLERPLDHKVFQACVNSLLSEVYPSLVPLEGGNDAGTDGAIADGEGEAYPLVVTTAQDGLRNLSKNLDSHRGSGSQRRRVVFATSRALSPPQRRKLEARAREKGYVLVQVHDRNDLASRLYRNSRWTQELLGLTGAPSALSAIPLRSLRDDVPLIGRDQDLEWLRQSRGDRLLVGQPGSGKTHLLLQLVRDGKALFLDTDDEAEIANDCRDLEPAIILVDDAHLDPARLERLRRLRSSIEVDFDIIATTWPGYADDVVAALAPIREENPRFLELLTRRQIVEVLRAVGVQGPDDDPALRLLVDQSVNRPGLAVLLGSLWLRGERVEVLSGEALRGSLVPALRRVLESDPTHLLACFALGGDRGMCMAAVAEFLQLGRDEMRQRVVLASQGGVLEVLDGDRLSVQPPSLRSALIGGVFFGNVPLPYRELLTKVPDLEEAALTLILASHAGAAVPGETLRALVEGAPSPSTWEAFAALGVENAQWALEHYPGEVVEIASVALRRAPRAALQRLLRATVSQGAPHSHPTHPLRLLRDWVQEIPFGPGGQGVEVEETLFRRRILIEEVTRYIDAGGDRDWAIRAGALALGRALESSRMTATGDAVTLHRAALTAFVSDDIVALWEQLRGRIRVLSKEVWRALAEVLREWSVWEDETDEDRQRVRVAARIIHDLVPLSVSSPGLQSSLKIWAERVGVDVELPSDPVYAELFPALGAHREERTRQRQEASALGREWSRKEPREVTDRLAGYADEADRYGDHDSMAALEFCRALAEAAEEPEIWLRAWFDRKLNPAWLSFMLRRVVLEKRSGWAALLEECLRSSDYSWMAADLAIQIEGLPADLLDLTLDLIPPHFAEGAVLRREVPIRRLRRLLLHERKEIAQAAAVGEWLADPQGQVRGEVRSEWQDVVLSTDAESVISDYWFQMILGSDADLAFSWLTVHIKDAGRAGIHSDLYAAAVKALSCGQRVSLLRDAPARNSNLIRLLVGCSPLVYQKLLSHEHLRETHLEPLAGRPPDDQWLELAQLALQAGHDPARIAAAAFWPGRAIAGFGVEHWSKWKDAFEKLVTSGCDGPLHQVAEHGLDFAVERVARAESRRRQFELSGSW